MPGWKSDSKGNHFQHKEKPHLNSSGPSTNSDQTMTSKIQPSQILKIPNSIPNQTKTQKIMNRKLAAKGVAGWYHQLHLNDRATIFDITESRTHHKFENERFDLSNFPLKYSDEFVQAVVDWKLGKQELRRGHERNQIKSALIRQGRAEQFKGKKTEDLRNMLHVIGSRDKNSKKWDDLQEEILQRELEHERIISPRLDPKFPSNGDPMSFEHRSTLQQL